MEAHDPAEEAIQNLNSFVAKFANDHIIANIEIDWIKEMVSEFKDCKESYTQTATGKGANEDGSDYIIVRHKMGI